MEDEGDLFFDYDINCTGNMSMHEDCEGQSPMTSFAKARIILYIISFLLSLIGNSCVVLVTLKKIYKKANVGAFKLLIAHLALVDFLYSCNIFVLIPNELYETEMNDRLPMCTFKRLLRQAPYMASIGNVVVIAIERYKSISHDLSVRKWSKRRICVSLLIVWVVSFAVFIPETISVDTKDGDIECYKNMNLALIRANAVFLLLVEYVLPLCIIGFCNYKVIRVIKSRKMIRLQTQDMQERDNEQKKSVRILLAIVIGFAVLALPNQIFFGYLEIGNKFHDFTQEWDILQMSAVILLFHASFNAVLYSIVDEEFRRDVKELFCCCFEKFPFEQGSSSFSTSATGVNSKAYEMTDVNSSV